MALSGTCTAHENVSYGYAFLSLSSFSVPHVWKEWAWLSENILNEAVPVEMVAVYCQGPFG